MSYLFFFFFFFFSKQKLDEDATPIEINQIRSVKVGRPGRSIPKAFEIFTSDKTYVLKAKDGKNAEEWVQCLSIAVASSHARDTPSSRPVSQHFSLAQSQFGLRTTVWNSTTYYIEIDSIYIYIYAYLYMCVYWVHLQFLFFWLEWNDPSLAFRRLYALKTRE